MKEKEQKAELYACLWMLMNEEHRVIFHDRQKTFLEYWSEKQHQFVHYYEAEYATRIGNVVF